jgi:O-antigen/teichoic acid export membrane protein
LGKSKYKKLIGNSFIFAVGNLGSKLITIIMVPVYTFTLSTQEYGAVDLVQTTANLLLPIITLSIFDAAFRFALDDGVDSKKVFTNSFFVTIVCSALGLLVVPLFKIAVGDLYIFLYIIVVLQSFQSLMSEFARAIGKVKTFAANGIITTLFLTGSNILFLVVFQYGVNGYLWSIIIATVISILFLIFSLRVQMYIDRKLLEWQFIHKLLIYSIPLIPNAFAWWINNASSRYFILYFIGVSANGLYAVANKIPSLLSVLNSIFFQSWQMSAVEEYSSENREAFYSNVFRMYLEMLFLATAAILFIVKPMMSLVVSKQFYVSWKLVPFLLLTVVYSSVSGFLGTNYIAAKKTTGIFVTTVLGAVLNIMFNMIFIPQMGINGAGLSSMLSFLVIFVIRYFDTKKITRIKIDKKNFLMNHLVVGTQIAVMLLISNEVLMLALNCCLLILTIFIDKEVLGYIFKSIITQIKRRIGDYEE